MRIPNKIRSKMHLCAKHAAEAAKYDREIGEWLERHGIDVCEISSGDGESLEELMYGNDVTDAICEYIEAMDGGEGNAVD